MRDGLSTVERAAIAAFADKHGRTWKKALRHAWMNASEPGVLQALRNASYFGPVGLIYYKLSEVAK